MMTSSPQLLDPVDLARACGGQEAAPAPATRTWPQVFADYGNSCIKNATQAMIFGGRPGRVADAAVSFGMGCAMGLAVQGADDFSRFTQRRRT